MFSDQDRQIGSSPTGRGGAGAYVEGELGAFYLLALLADSEPRGLSSAKLTRVQFQGADHGFALDDLILHAARPLGALCLEIQSKRSITFSPKDPLFEAVCRQIAASRGRVASDEHQFAVATQRTSFAISGPYQDALEWAQRAESAAAFFARVASPGVGGPSLRAFVQVFRSHLVEAGVADEDDAIWRILKRFQILEFDFESSAPLARTYALTLAGLMLAPEDAGRVASLWGNLIEISVATAKAGGSIDRAGLRQTLIDRGFHLAGDRDFTVPRQRLAEMAEMALAHLGDSIGGVHLPREAVQDAVDQARDTHRFVEIRGVGGVGKSSILRTVATRMSRESTLFVLDPVGTPEGGWAALGLQLGVTTTAKAFLQDLAASGGAVLFIDSLEMFTTEGRRRTVNDLLNAVAAIPGFSVVATARPDFGEDGGSWISPSAATRFGPPVQVEVGELNDAEVELLREQTPELRALLAPSHPAAALVRNLYRLSRLLKTPASAEVRTEAGLALHWWRTADGAPDGQVKAGQRLMADLADHALAGGEGIDCRDDTPARSHLLASQTLSEGRRDHLTFYHDVLRDWAIGVRTHEEPQLLDRLDLTAPASARVSRGVEMAARLALEQPDGTNAWLALLSRLSVDGAHGSWRRHALLAILRSELGLTLLQQCGDALLAGDGALFVELCATTAAVETVSAAAHYQSTMSAAGLSSAQIPTSLRISTSPAALRLLIWCVQRRGDVPMPALEAAVSLVEIHLLNLLGTPPLAEPVAKMVFGWLSQLDVDEAPRTIPPGASPLSREAFRRLVDALRFVALPMAAHDREGAKAYLHAITAEDDEYKIRAIRPYSKSLVAAAPLELAALIKTSLIEPSSEGREKQRRGHNRGRGRGRRRDRAFKFSDADYMPASPAQPPFLDLLEASPADGLNLVRTLVQEAVDFKTDGADPAKDGFWLQFDQGPRFFPWTGTYFWSRGRSNDSSVGSALMALEAWGHDRLDSGQPLDEVLHDILGTDGGCAAYVLVAIDLLLSHWPRTREALVPYMACPALIATERGRSMQERIGGHFVGFNPEPAGRVQLAGLAARPSRQLVLEQALAGYVNFQGDDPVAQKVRALLEEAISKLEAYPAHADFGDPAFMGAHALDVLDSANWTAVEGGRQFQATQREREHMARLSDSRNPHLQEAELEAKIHLALDKVENRSPALAREASDYAGNALPDGGDTDALKSRTTRLITIALLIARDGDEALLAERADWVRAAVAEVVAMSDDDRGGASQMLRFNRPALAACALIHLWRRLHLNTDRDALLGAVSRHDHALAPAFVAAREAIHATDPRLLKSAVRVVLTTARWRWASWDEDPALAAAYKAGKAQTDQAAVAAEISWLDGGAEPAWPAFPPEKPSFRQPSRIRIPGPAAATFEIVDEEDDDLSATRASVHVATQVAAPWLRLLDTPFEADRRWSGEIVKAYAVWTAQQNGSGEAADRELDRSPSDWNGAFYSFAANAMLDSDEARCDALVRQVEALPDEPFGDVVEVLVHALDVRYFNNPAQSADRPVQIRKRLVTRTLAMSRWDRVRRSGDLSIDRKMGGAVATLLMNSHNFSGASETYLVPAVFDRVDPILEVVRPLLSGGPTAFIALCTLNTLLVAPRARHAGFLIEGAEAWLAAFPSDPGFWVNLGVGQKIVRWFSEAAQGDPSLLSRGHPLRIRIDAILDRLVALGIAEAHELEARVGLA